MDKSLFATHEDYLQWYRDYRAKNREKLREYNKNYNKDFRKKNGYTNEEKWKKSNPQKVRAQHRARKALANNELLQLPCELCDSVETVMHHDDYSKPLEIRWLCKMHHRQIHYRELKWEELSG